MIPLRDPAAFVRLPHLDTGLPEPVPAGGEAIHAVHFRRSVGTDDVVRSVVLETSAGTEPLPRRIRYHGDDDEGWDWGWHGSAPLETALNLLAAFVHPRAAWRLQWAFYEAFLHPLPVAGGTLRGDEVRAWLRTHAWVGRPPSWGAAPEAGRLATLERERDESRALSPDARAERIHHLVVSALRWDEGARREATGDVALLPAHPDAEGAEGPGSAGFQLVRAAAVLAGAAPPERWATLAALADILPTPGSLLRQAWSREASPVTSGLPGPETIEAVARAWRVAGNKAPRERADVVAAEIGYEAESRPGRWTSVPLLSLALGAGCESAYRGEAYLAGDPVSTTGTLRALAKRMADDPGLASAAARLGLTGDTLADRRRAAAELHAWTLRAERRRLECGAAHALERVHAAAAARLPRGRSPAPAPSSAALRGWVLAASVHVVLEMARGARGPAGALTLRAALAGAGLHFPDPPETVAQTVAWYLEERAPSVMDLPSFPARADGLFRTGPAQVAGTGAGNAGR
jgi:hypothetical protein